MENSDVKIKDEPLLYPEHQDEACGMTSETKDSKENAAETSVPTYPESPIVKLQPKEELNVSDIEMIREEIYFIDCLHCPVTFSSETTLNEHYKSHHYCKLCKDSFNDERYFYTHILDCHINYNTIPTTCQFCTDKIIDNDILTHMKEHAFIKDKNVNKKPKGRGYRVKKSIIGIFSPAFTKYCSKPSNQSAVIEHIYTDYQDVETSYKRRRGNKKIKGKIQKSKK